MAKIKPWTATEIAYLHEFYPKHGARRCAAHLERSYLSVKSRAYKDNVQFAGEHSALFTAPNQAMHRSSSQYTTLKQCRECGEHKPEIKFPWTASNGRCHLRHACTLCTNRGVEERKKLRATHGELIAAVETTAPCEGCYKREHCKATGWTCLAFEHFVETGKVVRAWIGMTEKRRAA